MSEPFVIHLHAGHGPEHCDLMLRRGEALATWRLDRRPDRDTPFPIPAERIADHRLAYLTYQGPVSRGRGRVTRIDTGTYELLSRTDDDWTFRLEGEKLWGAFRLRRTGERDQWLLEKVDPKP